MADKRLARIEEEQTGEIEDETMAMMLLRHESGHTIAYAYRLWKEPGWTEVFGPFSKPYREVFHPQPLSRQFVRHIYASQYGRTYAEKHPDEDFAETFAVWLTPPVELAEAVSLLAGVGEAEVRRWADAANPRAEAATHDRQARPSDRRNDHALGRALRPAGRAVPGGGQGFVDDRLRVVFPRFSGNSAIPAKDLLKKNHKGLLERLTRWSSFDRDEAEAILLKLEDRAGAQAQGHAPRRDVSDSSTWPRWPPPWPSSSPTAAG